MVRRKTNVFLEAVLEVAKFSFFDFDYEQDVRKKNLKYTSTAVPILDLFVSVYKEFEMCAFLSLIKLNFFFIVDTVIIILLY